MASELPLAEAFLICVAHVEAVGSKLLLGKKKKIKKLGCGVGEWCSQGKQMWQHQPAPADSLSQWLGEVETTQTSLPKTAPSRNLGGGGEGGSSP